MFLGLGSRYPDEEAGQIPMAFVVRNPGSNIGEAQVIGFMAKQVTFLPDNSIETTHDEIQSLI